MGTEAFFFEPHSPTTTEDQPCRSPCLSTCTKHLHTVSFCLFHCSRIGNIPAQPAVSALPTWQAPSFCAVIGCVSRLYHRLLPLDHSLNRYYQLNPRNTYSTSPDHATSLAMAELHEALKALSPTDWDDVPVDDLRPYMTDLLIAGELICNSVPPPADGTPFHEATPHFDQPNAATSHKDVVPSQARSYPPDTAHESLQKNWGKAMKFSARERIR